MAEPPELQILGDRYELTERIGSGGMAHVYLGVDRLLRRQVAVKILDAQSAADAIFVERFRREAQAVAQLSHPNIVSIFDWGSVAGTYYMVMEYVPGENLKERLRRGAVPESDALDIAAQTAAALSIAHQHGIIHRDIKPQNILLAPSGLVKVVDFGIAYTPGVTQLTRTNAVAGTAHYLSPEQAQSKPLDQRTDIYSLGVVLFEMVTGREPFQGGSLVEIAMHHVHEAPPDPAALSPGLSEQTTSIILRALAKKRDDRFHDAAEMRAALLKARADLLGRPAVPPPHAPIATSTDDTASEATATARTRHVGLGRTSPAGSARSEARRWPTRLLMAVPILLLLLIGIPLLLMNRPSHHAVPPPSSPVSAAQRKATPTPRPSPTPPPTTRPATATIAPAAVPTATALAPTQPVPTQMATALPTRAPQVAVLQHTPGNAAASSANGPPSRAVYEFYRAISSGNLAGAESLETDNMKANYPPQENIYQRFAYTKQITIQPPSVLVQHGHMAQVSVTGFDVEKAGSPRSSQSFHLVWTLTKHGNRWMLDDVST